MTDTRNVREINDPNRGTEPGLAAIYKVARYFERRIEEGVRPWDVLDEVRLMVGQRPREMDGVNYHEIRDYVEWFLDKWGIK